MIQRYTGACNVQTVIKEASFLGDGGGYVASGSDDGRCVEANERLDHNAVMQFARF